MNWLIVGLEEAEEEGMAHGQEEDHLVIFHHGKDQDGHMEEEHVGDFWEALTCKIIQMRKKKKYIWKLRKKN